MCATGQGALHPNEELLRRGYAAFETGDVETTLHLLDEGIAWHMGGRNLLTGEYRGRDAVREFFAKQIELTKGTFRIELHDVLANDEHAIAIGLMTGKRKGRTLEQKFVHVFHANGEVATEWWHLPLDPYADDEFWS